MEIFLFAFTHHMTSSMQVKIVRYDWTEKEYLSNKNQKCSKERKSNVKFTNFLWKHLQIAFVLRKKQKQKPLRWKRGY